MDDSKKDVAIDLLIVRLVREATIKTRDRIDVTTPQNKVREIIAEHVAYMNYLEKGTKEDLSFPRTEKATFDYFMKNVAH